MSKRLNHISFVLYLLYTVKNQNAWETFPCVSDAQKLDIVCGVIPRIFFLQQFLIYLVFMSTHF